MVKRGKVMLPEGRKAGRVQRTAKTLEKPIWRQGGETPTRRNCTTCKDETKTIFPERLKLAQTENLESFSPCSRQNSGKHDKQKEVPKQWEQVQAKEISFKLWAT